MRTLTAILFCALAGCASGPSRPSRVHRSPPPLPPLPPRVVKMPPLPPGFPAQKLATVPRQFSFTPASVVPDRPIYIYSYFDEFIGTNCYTIVARQIGGGGLEMQTAENIKGPWTFLAGFGYYPETQYVLANVPARGPQLFIRAINTPAWAAASAIASAKADLKDSGKSYTLNGRTYRMMRVNEPGDPIQMYRLQPK